MKNKTSTFINESTTTHSKTSKIITDEQWQVLVNEFQQSDITVRGFCKLHNIHPSSFYPKFPDLNQALGSNLN